MIVGQLQRAVQLPRTDEETIDGRVGIHDNNQFEVKLDYRVDPNERQSRYHVEAWFFVPKSLGINPFSYRREQFYADVHSYIRFKTPSIPLVAVLDADNAASPLTRIQRIGPELLRRPTSRRRQGRLRRELRMFGCLLRAHLRDRVTDMRARLTSEASELVQQPVRLGDLQSGIATLLGELEEAIGRYRGLRSLCLRPEMPTRVQDAYRYVDEYLSLVVEWYLTLLLEAIDREAPVRSALQESRARIVERILDERNHRRGAGYPSLLEPDAPNEEFVYRMGVLKKFVMSVLFLEMDKEQEGRGLLHFFAAIAAAIAMLVSILALMWSSSRWATFSAPWIVAGVISYAFKDRIKDWVRHYFAGKLGRWLSDYNTRIRDPEKEGTVGRCRESFAYVDPDRVPRRVLSCRHSDAHGTLETEEKPEVIMRYVKRVRLSNKVIGQLHGRLGDINDIMRFTVSSFQARMDDPVRKIRSYSPESDRVELLTCPKVYHVNIVFELRAAGDDERTTIQRFRVVLDRDRIRRLERVV
ncbi:MAG: hypothetical protein D6776_05475 [Planctomycetota bacterium]|nr:MAG: hypothetical protein D6776_05475 [Planctomycetota bacterium]